MYLRLTFENLGEAVVFIYDDHFTRRISKNLPIESNVIKWKEEIYFRIGIDFDSKNEKDTVSPGTVAFWPPEKSLCLFYGVNQPYGSVIPVGKILGPLHCFEWVENGVGVRVEEYKDYGKLGKIASFLRENGILAAYRDWEDFPSIVASINDIQMEIFVEDYALIIETTPLFLYDKSPISNYIISRLKKKISRTRLDINEENYVILSAVVHDPKDLPEMIWSLSREYKIAKRTAQTFFKIH